MFKHCHVCQHTWTSRQEFIDAPDVELIGYQVNFKKLEAGLLYFNHACKNTIAVPADVFADLYEGPVFEERKTETEECPGYCLNQERLRRCPAKCECAYIREIIQLLKKDK
jgi:hypothetical protein